MTNKKPVLTARELETLALVAEGQSDRQIAKTLATSPSTIRNKLCTIRLKLAAYSPKSLSKRANLAMFFKQQFATKEESND
jgi:DNA-binding NarL/FixJ family response regulator